MDRLIEQRAKRETLRRLKQSEVHFNCTLPAVEIRFDLSGRAAGMIQFPARGRPVIRFNRILLKENGEAFIQQTIPHEVAHLVARTLHGQHIRPHGREWQQVMHFYGAEAKRCHQFDTARSVKRRLRQFDYHCSCSSHRLTTIRHHRVLRGQSYLCRRCGDALKATPSASETTPQAKKSAGEKR